jgi:hypothetical protein
VGSGWDRASIEFRSRPNRLPERMSNAEIYIPQMSDRLTLFAACLGCGACISVLWIYIPAWIVAVLSGNDLTPWLFYGMLAGALACGVLLFLIALPRENRYAEELL